MKTRVLLIGLMTVASAYAAPNATNGKTLFSKYCQSCHGASAAGVQGLGPVLKGEVAGWKFDIFKRAVLNGIDDHGKTLGAAMPRWGTTGFSGKKPTDAQLQDLHAYLKTLK